MGASSSGVTTGLALLAAAALLLGHQAAQSRGAAPMPTGAADPEPLAAVSAAPAPTAVDYDWPTGAPVTVLRPFDGPSVPWAGGHRGVDLDLVDGSAVRAAADGVVAFAGTVVDRGVVSVDHADGIRTTYEPVTATVVRGEVVDRGDVLGRLAGRGHCAPAGCVHWGARRGPDSYLDPMSLLRQAGVVRLLPLGDR